MPFTPMSQKSRLWLTSLFCIFAFGLTATHAQDVRINEFVSSNGSTIFDEDGEFEDWIELVNMDTNAVNLDGWGLSDNPAKPFRWTFPSVTLQPGEYLVVFASGKNRKTREPIKGLIREVYSDIPGTSLTNLIAHPSFPDSPSSVEVVTNFFEAPIDVADDYGQRMRGWFSPPSDGNYRFTIASDDNGGLWLSTNESPENATLIASVTNWTNSREWEKSPSQTSVWITLRSNQIYYMEALMKESIGGDNLAVRFQKQNPNGFTEAPMNAARFRAMDGYFHTDFGISSSGEPLQLTRPDSSVADIVDAVALPYNVAWARIPNGTGDFAYVAQPTPGRANTSPAVTLPPPVYFSEPHGYKTAGFSLSITSPAPDAVIRYTLNGREPNLSSPIYTNALYITNTTFIRASAWTQGMHRLPPATATYIFLDDVLRQNGSPPAGWPAHKSVNNHAMEYGLLASIVTGDTARLRQGMTNAIASISIVTDLTNLFGAASGIYVNPGVEGLEQPASVEILDPVRGLEHQVQANAGVRIRGAHSRSPDNPKHSFRLFFRGKYGDSKLSFPLFDQEGVDEFDKVDLRTEQNHSWSWYKSASNTFVREVFSRDTQRDMGEPYTRSRYYHLYLNGIYWGLYQTQERGNADYAESYLGGDERDWDTIKTTQPSYTTQATDGNLDAFRELHNIALNQGFSGANSTNYWRVRGRNSDGSINTNLVTYLDEDNLIDYMLVSYFTGDPDGPISGWLDRPNNMYALFNRVNPTGFKWLRHDAEHSLGAESSYTVNWDTTTIGSGNQYRNVTNFNPATLHLQLISNVEYRVRFADRVQRHFYNGGALTVEKSLERINKRTEEIDLAIIGEAARWGHGMTRDNQWMSALHSVTNYIQQRPTIVLNQFRTRGWITQMEVPDFTRAQNWVRIHAEEPFYYLAGGGDPRLPGGGIHPDAIAVTNRPNNGAPSFLIQSNAVWRYYDIGDEPASTNGKTWRDVGFADQSWSNGPAILGYEGFPDINPVATETRRWVSGTSGAQVATTYLRHSFNLISSADITQLVVNLLRDDGAIVYLNGTEILRDNMPAGPVDYSTYSSSVVGSPEQNQYFRYPLNVAHLLNEGENVIAVELHQCNDTSTDLYFDLSLEAKGDNHYEAWAPIPYATTFKARALTNGVWSALGEFSAAPLAGIGEDLHVWDFENNPFFRSPSFTVGGASMTNQPGPGTDIKRNAAAQNFSTAHLRVDNPLGSELIFNLPTVGYENLALSFLTRRSGSGAGLQSLAYTTNGSTWIPFTSYEVIDGTPVEMIFNFAGITAVENNSNFAIRITFDEGAGGAAGNNRFDDVRLKGTPIPGFNRPPEVVNPLPDLTAIEGETLSAINLATVFNDPDGDELTFDAASSATSIVAVALSGTTNLTLTPISRGGATITVTANDGKGDPVVANFYVLVYPSAHVLSNSAFAFDSWDSNQPANTYPANMLFVQSTINDPGLNAALSQAYAIPLADAGQPGDADFPYAATSRTRINGLGADGIAFINTGRGRDVGGALLALDTRGVTNAPVSWLGGTVLANNRIYAIRLQYRIGTTGEFADVQNEASEPVEYLRNATNGHTAALGPVALPAAALGQEYVQLLWRYYYISGSSSRAQLRLDDILVNNGEQPPATGYAAWKQAEFNEAEQADPAISGPLADPTDSGIANLMRYALGLNRTNEFRSALPVADLSLDDPPIAVLRHRRLLDPESGVEYILEYSTNLESHLWTEALLNTDLVYRAATPTGDGITESVEYEVPENTLPPPRFFRLKVWMTE